MPRDYGEMMAEAAADGYDSPAEMASARRIERQAAAELEAEYAEQVQKDEEPAD